MEGGVALSVLAAGLAAGTVALTVSRGRPFAIFRAYYGPETWFGGLIHCPWCLSHWAAFGLVAASGAWDGTAVGLLVSWLCATMVGGLSSSAVWLMLSSAPPPAAGGEGSDGE